MKAKQPEVMGNKVSFDQDWTWKEIFLWIKRQNRDVDCWKEQPGRKAICHLKPILK